MGLRGKLPKLIMNFITDREFCVGIGVSYSVFFFLNSRKGCLKETCQASNNWIIQTSINKLSEWTKTKGLKFAVEKSVGIKFEKKNEVKNCS